MFVFAEQNDEQAKTSVIRSSFSESIDLSRFRDYSLFFLNECIFFTKRAPFLSISDLMLKNRVFLYCLYSESKHRTKQRLNVATSQQVKVLLHVIHHVSEGQIPLPKNHFNKLKRTRKLHLVNKCQGTEDFKKLLSTEKEHQVAYLKGLWSLYPSLLHALFHHTPIPSR